MYAVLGAVLFFGWPIIEAVLLVLPTPDPAWFSAQFAKLVALVSSLPAAFKGDGKGSPQPGGAAAGYQQDFEQAPSGLQDDEDEDEDEEDVGGAALKGGLNYDSGEGEANELISLDSKPKKAVPKLKGPRK